MPHQRVTKDTVHAIPTHELPEFAPSNRAAETASAALASDNLRTMGELIDAVRADPKRFSLVPGLGPKGKAFILGFLAEAGVTAEEFPPLEGHVPTRAPAPPEASCGACGWSVRFCKPRQGDDRLILIFGFESQEEAEGTLRPLWAYAGDGHYRMPCVQLHAEPALPKSGLLSQTHSGAAARRFALTGCWHDGQVRVVGIFDSLEEIQAFLGPLWVSDPAAPTTFNARYAAALVIAPLAD